MDFKNCFRCLNFSVEAVAEATTGQLDFRDMAGIFYVFAGFIGLAFLTLVLEFCYAASLDDKKDKRKVCQGCGTCFFNMRNSDPHRQNV